ncbi:MAG: hypothetical protein AAB337_04120 [Patescibacteria group bacterium]
MPQLPLNLESYLLPLIGLMVAGLILMVLVSRARRWLKVNWARRQHGLNLEEMRERWKRIERLAGSPEHEGDRLAIIEADKLLDFVFKQMHIPGDTFAIRIKFAQSKYFQLKRVRWAHELRNKLVHEPDFILRSAQAHSALKEFYKALRLLGAL